MVNKNVLSCLLKDGKEVNAQVPPLKLRHYGGIQMRILLLLLLLVSCLQTPDGYEVGGDGETEAAAGDGWEDADNWESFELTTATSPAKSAVSFTELFDFVLLLLLTQMLSSSSS